MAKKYYTVDKSGQEVEVDASLASELVRIGKKKPEDFTIEETGLNIPGVDVSGIDRDGKIKSPYSDPIELQQRILQAKRDQYRETPFAQRMTVGMGQEYASTPGLQQLGEMVSGQEISKEDLQEMRDVTSGDFATSLGGFLGDLTMTVNPAMWASKYSILGKMVKPGWLNNIIKGFQAGAASTGIHQAQEMQKTGEPNKAMALAETGISGFLPGVSSLAGAFFKKAAPKVMRTHVKPLLDQTDVVNSVDFENVFKEGVNVPYFGGVEGLQGGLKTELDDIYLNRALNAKYASIKPNIQLLGKNKTKPKDSPLMFKSASPSQKEIFEAKKLKSPIGSDAKGYKKGSDTIIKGNVSQKETLKALKHYSNKAENLGRKDFENMEQEVLSLIRGPGYKIPASGYSGASISARGYVEQRNKMLSEGLETGFGEAEALGLEKYGASSLPNEFTHQGVYLKRVNSLDPKVIKFKDADGKVFEFGKNSPVYIDPIQTLPTEKIFQANDYLAYIDDINKAKPIVKQESKNIIDNVRKKLKSEVSDPTKKWIPKKSDEAIEAIDYWKEQGLGRPSVRDGKMTIEDAMGFRQAIDEEINFRTKAQALTNGFNDVSMMFRRELNDFIKKKAPEVARLTDRAAKLEPLNKAVIRRAKQEANNYKMGALDMGALGIAGGFGAYGSESDDRLKNALLLGLGGLGARRLFGTVGGASMLNDMGQGLTKMATNPSKLQQGLAQSGRSGLSNMLENPYIQQTVPGLAGMQLRGDQ